MENDGCKQKGDRWNFVSDNGSIEDSGSISSENSDPISLSVIGDLDEISLPHEHYRDDILQQIDNVNSSQDRHITENDMSYFVLYTNPPSTDNSDSECDFETIPNVAVEPSRFSSNDLSSTGSTGSLLQLQLDELKSVDEDINLNESASEISLSGSSCSFSLCSNSSDKDGDADPNTCVSLQNFQSVNIVDKVGENGSDLCEHVLHEIGLQSEKYLPPNFLKGVINIVPNQITGSRLDTKEVSVSSVDACKGFVSLVDLKEGPALCSPVNACKENHAANLISSCEPSCDTPAQIASRLEEVEPADIFSDETISQSLFVRDIIIDGSCQSYEASLNDVVDRELEVQGISSQLSTPLDDLGRPDFSIDDFNHPGLCPPQTDADDTVLLNVLERFVLSSIRRENSCWRMSILCFIISAASIFIIFHFMGLGINQSGSSCIKWNGIKSRTSSDDTNSTEIRTDNEPGWWLEANEKIYRLQSEVLSLKQKMNELRTEMDSVHLQSTKLRYQSYMNNQVERSSPKSYSESMTSEPHSASVSSEPHDTTNKPPVKDNHNDGQDKSDYIQYLRHKLTEAQRRGLLWHSRYLYERRKNIKLTQNPPFKSYRSQFAEFFSNVSIAHFSNLGLRNFIGNFHSLADLDNFRNISEYIISQWQLLLDLHTKQKDPLIAEFQNIYNSTKDVISNMFGFLSNSLANFNTDPNNKRGSEKDPVTRTSAAGSRGTGPVYDIKNEANREVEQDFLTINSQPTYQKNKGGSDIYECSKNGNFFSDKICHMSKRLYGHVRDEWKDLRDKFHWPTADDNLASNIDGTWYFKRKTDMPSEQRKVKVGVDNTYWYFQRMNNHLHNNEDAQKGGNRKSGFRFSRKYGTHGVHSGIIDGSWYFKPSQVKPLKKSFLHSSAPKRREAVKFESGTPCHSSEGYKLVEEWDEDCVTE